MARKPARASLSSYIADRKDQIASLRRSLAEIEACRGDFKFPMVEANVILDRAARYAEPKAVHIDPRVWCDSDWRDLALTLHFTLRVESLKEGAVPEMCQFIMDLGYNPRSTDDYVSADYAERVYRFTKKIGDVNVRVNFTAEPDSESATCRRVQTGFEVREVPTYAIECN